MSQGRMPWYGNNLRPGPSTCLWWPFGWFWVRSQLKCLVGSLFRYYGEVHILRLLILQRSKSSKLCFLINYQAFKWTTKRRKSKDFYFGTWNIFPTFWELSFLEENLWKFFRLFIWCFNQRIAYCSSFLWHDSWLGSYRGNI